MYPLLILIKNLRTKNISVKYVALYIDRSFSSVKFHAYLFVFYSAKFALKAEFATYAKYALKAKNVDPTLPEEREENEEDRKLVGMLSKCNMRFFL